LPACPTKYFPGQALSGDNAMAPQPSLFRRLFSWSRVPGPTSSGTDRKCPRGDDGIPLIWEPGDVILEQYEVRNILGEGGMGRVNLVWHRGWQMQLAVKSVRPDKLASRSHLENFQREAEVWVSKLGLHPNIVSCYYVRVLGGLPRVFIDYVDGGSLEEWILSGKLYEGGPEQALERMLDIAIQFAWGLHHAHEQGLIHQDVKPHNVMMTGNGVARVTDFGLANARAELAEQGERPASLSLLATWGGMTPKYCSPEQAGIEAKQKAGVSRKQWPKLTRRTDIWSWAVSVLEMFLGEAPWPSGSVADHYLKTQVEGLRIPQMCPAMAELLHCCLQPRPEDRPHDLLEVAGTLQTIYLQVTGKAYPREAPRAAELLADSLNNRAVSLADLGKQEEAEKAWGQALQADPLHPEATYNLGLERWRSGQIDDFHLLEQLRPVCAGHPDRWEPTYYLALVHLERDDCEGAIRVLEAPDTTASRRDEVQRLLGRLKDRLPESSRCLRTFEGHTLPVFAICLSSDGRLALSGSSDKTLKMWEVSNGRCLRTFDGHTKGVSSVCLSRDGRLALSGSESDHILKLWEVCSGRCLRTFGEGYWRSACLSSDAQLALAGSGRGESTVELWDLSSGRCLRTFEGHKGVVYSVCLSSDDRLALSGSSDKTLKLWEVSSGRCLRTFEGHTDIVSAVCLSCNGRLALSGGSDNTMKLWEVSTGCCLRTFERHEWTERKVSVCLSSDSCLALSGSKTLKLWNISPIHTRFPSPAMLSRPAKETYTFQNSYKALLARVDQAVTQGEDPGLVVGSLRQARQLLGCSRRHEVLNRWFTFYSRLPQAGLLAGWQGRTFEGHRSGVYSVCLSSDGRLALSGGVDGRLKLWEVSSGRCLRTFEGHTNSVHSVFLSNDGYLALSGSSDETLKLWEVSSGRCLRTFKGHNYVVSSVCLSSDGRLALSGSWEKTPKLLRLWEVSSGRCLRSFEGHRSNVHSVCLSMDGRLALSGGDDNTLKLWEVSSGRCLRTFEGHRLPLHSVCLRMDARFALSGSVDTTLKLWEVSSGRCLRTFEGHTDDVNSVCLSSDGRVALSGSRDKTLKLWEVSSGRCLRTFEGHKDSVCSVCLSCDGRLALSGSHDRSIQVWILDWDLEAKRRSDWDEGARPYLEMFLSAHTPWGAELPVKREPSEQELQLALTRRGKPRWTERDFERLLFTLGCAGYGWLRPEGVRRELEKMAASWQGPPPLA
jgi:WD40 repeat protein/serine/threonine protein kinase